MKHWLLTYPGSSRTEETVSHLRSSGINPNVFPGFNGVESGLECTIPSRFSTPERKLVFNGSHIGCTLSHLALYKHIARSECLDDVLVLEDDVRLREGWKDALDDALSVVPPNWDVLYLGGSFTQDKPRTLIGGNVWQVRWPLTTHAFILRPKSIYAAEIWKGPICEQIDVWWMQFYESGHLVPYCILPRLADQNNTPLPE